MCECFCDKVMALFCTSYILFFVLVHLLLLLYFFILYVYAIGHDRKYIADSQCGVIRTTY